MNKPFNAPEPGEARCPAPSVQDVLRRDADGPPPAYTLESYSYLGSEDIPFERYTSRAFFDREMEKMWPHVWQWACREEHIPEVGDYYVYDVGPYSLIVMRTAPDEIKAYYNACLHRGTKLKPSGSAGSSESISCPFHGWTWSLDGELTRLLCEWDFPHVDKEEFRLPEARVGTWGGFVFVNMDENAPSLEEYLAPLPEHAKRAAFEDRYVSLHVEKELPCNWKVAQEAFMEAYHLLATHPQLLPASGDINTQYDVFSEHVDRLYNLVGSPSPLMEREVSEQEVLDSMVLGDRESLGGKLTVPEGVYARQVMAAYFRDLMQEHCGKDCSDYSTAEMIDTVGYFAFPNGHFFLAISFPIIYRFRPLGMDQTKTLFDLILLSPVPKDGPRPEPYEPYRVKIEESYGVVPGIDPGLAVIYDQDTGNMGWQQEGFGAAKKKRATLGNYQEVRIRNMHRTLDRYLED
ncbi:MAG: Rieske 2Fe-2S domain-containing protein [Alphaproteobacteria bacterium]|nr:Rieske 2Fe-2S domain-containing protein [Alphaproteobacteria bacterium]